MDGASPQEAFPAAEGARLPWEALPERVVAAIEEKLGTRVVEATTQAGGFSPGIAVRVLLSDRGRAFIKAVGDSPNPRSPEFHRREAKIAAALPGTAPVARFLFCVDDGGWVALDFEDVPGANPVVPWQRADLERVLRAIADLTFSLTPSPIALDPLTNDSFPFIGWREIAADHKVDVGPWPRDNIELLLELEARWAEGAAGETLLHADLRADNILLTPDRVIFVDWPHACVGAAWVDLVFFLPSVAMQGGPEPWLLFDKHPLASAAAPDSVDAVVAALAGFFLWRGSSPPPPGLPGLPAFAWAQGVESLAWVRHRLEGRLKR